MTNQAASPRSRCSKCGAANSSMHLVFHHFICAYVGPDYDFKDPDGTIKCPKCHRSLTTQGADWEIIGDSQFCHTCGHEEMVRSLPHQTVE